MEAFNIYLAGVGGQGIGLLSEMILRAADHAGYNVKAVDTHGLAQRGGVVVSQVRIGTAVHTPLIPTHQADLIVALERHEAQRALGSMSKVGGVLIYYQTVWQPLEVRLGKAPEVSTDTIEAQCRERNVRLIHVFDPQLKDVRTQNVVLLANIQRHDLIPGIDVEHYRKAMFDLMAGSMLAVNSAIFEAQRQVA